MSSSIVLLYHALESPEEPFKTASSADYSVVLPLSKFIKQLQYLNVMGKRIISLDEMLLINKTNNKYKNVVITFDDGHRSNWSLAFPALLEAGVLATFYIVAGFVDKKSDYLTASQLRDLSRNGMTIGSHSMTHRFLPELSDDELQMELSGSRALLEDIIGKAVIDIAIPGGHYNRRIIDIAKQCGYRSVATCKVGIHRFGNDPYGIRRIEIRRTLSQKGFQNTFKNKNLLQLQAIEYGKAIFRRTFGLKNYTKIREVGHRYFDLSR